jgi:hypothetical protein
LFSFNSAENSYSIGGVFVAVIACNYPDQTDCELAGALIRDYLKPDADGKFGANAQEKRQGKLYKYAKNGMPGIGAEKVKDLRDHPTHCEELWMRKQSVKH